jgi:hypothetical protein
LSGPALILSKEEEGKMNYKVEDMGIKFVGVFPHETLYESSEEDPEEPLSIHRFEFFTSSENIGAVIDFSSFYHAESESRRLYNVMPAYEREEGFLDLGMSFGDFEFVKNAQDDCKEEEKDFFNKVNDLIQWIESHIEDNFIFAERFYSWLNIAVEN